ncbi:hypothetical protein TcasGA2_TC031818 [Tribolium castaneum]|uniref:Uncharacterized protein n=1 Tax=Tribolium castaneum TaxID=7070 RepID=A0A139WPQ1_TRICA|nr:hypothetical protein TcasGA2_TC031818 [Tribolium castaneum]
MKRALHAGAGELNCSTVEPLWSVASQTRARPRLAHHSPTLNDHSYIGDALALSCTGRQQRGALASSLRPIRRPMSLILLDLSTIPQVSLSCNSPDTE